MHELTDNQKQAIDRTGESLVVTAGAGSGKTLVLVERYLKLVSQADAADRLKGHDRIVAITFTDKAATEMRSKVSKRLRVERKDAGKPKAGYDELLEKLPAARISTIDSLCFEIVKHNPLHAGIIPDFEVMTPSDSLVLMERCVNQAAEEFMKQATSDDKEALIRIIKNFSKGLREFTQSMAWIINISAARGAFVLESTPVKSNPEDEIIAKIRDMAYKLYKDRLFKLRQVDFAGVEEAALRLLRSEFGDRIRTGIDYVLVDEYQDTNELQDEIIRLLVAGPGTTKEAILNSDKLFIVGDPKQSIYAFRGANPGLFNSWIALAGANGKLVDLDFNFRSHPNLIRSFNSLFPDLLGPSYLVAQSKETATDGDQRMKIIKAPYRGSKLEVKATANTIIRIVNDGLTLRNGKKASFGDFALLVSKNLHIDDYANEFRRKCIPFTVAKSDNIFGSDSIRFISALFGFIIDPEDDILAYNLLASPAVGVTEASIAGIATRSGSGIAKALIGLTEHSQDWSDVFIGSENNDANLLSRLIRFSFDNADKMSLYEFLEALAQSFSLEKMLLKGFGRQGVANFRKVKEIVRGENLDLGSIARLREYIDAYADAKTEVSEPDILDDSDDAVKIMTIHSAKGLEFPIVIVGKANFTLDEACSKMLLIDDKERNLHIAGGEGFDTIKGDCQNKQKEETARLIYVAYTRALDYLFLTGSHQLKDCNNEEKKHYLFCLLEKMNKLTKTDGQEPFEWLDAESIGEENAVQKASGPNQASYAVPKDGMLLSETSRIIRNSPSSLMLLKHDPEEYTRRYVFHLSKNKDYYLDKEAQHRRYSGSELGTFVHLICRLAETSDELEEAVGLAETSIYGCEKAGKELKEKAAELAGVFIRVNERGEKPSLIKKEEHFTLLINSNILEGAIDRIEEFDDGRMVVIDIKTNQIDEENRQDLIEKYSLQMEAYKLAAKRLLNKEDVIGYLRFVRSESQQSS